MSNDLASYVTFHVKPERLYAWKQAALKVLNVMRKEDTFVTCYMHGDAEGECAPLPPVSQVVMVFMEKKQ